MQPAEQREAYDRARGPDSQTGSKGREAATAIRGGMAPSLSFGGTGHSVAPGVDKACAASGRWPVRFAFKRQALESDPLLFVDDHGAEAGEQGSQPPLLDQFS